MKIALLGYGKMGHIVEQFAIGRNHEIVLTINSSNSDALTHENLNKVDIAIDFSTPYMAMRNIKACFEANLPLVIGTTGWYDYIDEVKNECLSTNQALLYGSNFSIGVNLFFLINKVLANLMNNHPQYDIQVEEIHHTQKIDAPSGTAITIAQDILSQVGRKKVWINNLAGTYQEQSYQPNQLLIESHRIEDVPGTHTVIYSSEVDEIALKHTAHNRNGFAIGAILAAEWLQGKTGFFSVADMFKFEN